MDADQLVATIVQIARRGKDERSTQVFFAYGVEKDGVDPKKEINSALINANDMERFELTMHLFRLWCEGSPEEARKVFGEMFDHYRPNKLVLMLAANNRKCELAKTDNLLLTLVSEGDQQQLRVWYDIPASIRGDHADSAGYGVLLDIGGHSSVVQRYLEEMLKICSGLSEVRLPNRARLFMKWEP